MGRGSGIRVRGTSVQISFYWRGQRFQKTLKLEPTKQNLKYAERLRSTILLEIAQGTFDPSKYFRKNEDKDESVLISVALTGWLDAVERTLSVSTFRGYSSAVNHRLIPAFGHLKMTDLTTQAIRQWIGTLTDITNKRINNLLTPLRAIFADAYQDGQIDRNPLDRIKNLPLATKEPEPFTPDEIVRILDAADPISRNLFQFAFWSGLRTSELIGLEWGDVDFEKGFVSVRRAVLRGHVKETKTQSGHRDIILLIPAKEALDRQKEHTFLQGPKGRVFCHPLTRKPFYMDQEIYRFWESLLRKAGVPFRNPYQTRHTYASLLLSAGENPMFVAQQMGHRDWGMIRKRYGRWIPSVDPEVGKRANALWKKSGENSDKMVTQRNG
ncbi:MAG: tyrosine-type recombinase/integrase [Nitrospiraceae bacterium]|nr:tyrosine-type recombinase/integrase [Nitrospiraceae bacterium]